jgi:hypothetical protein
MHGSLEDREDKDWVVSQVVSVAAIAFYDTTTEGHTTSKPTDYLSTWRQYSTLDGSFCATA